MKKYFLMVLLLIGATSLSQLHAEVDLTDNGGEKKIQIGGNGSLMFGQLAKGYAFGDNYKEKHWQYFYSGRIDITSTPVEWFKTKLSLEIASGWPVEFESTIMKSLMTEAFKPNLPQAVGIFNFDFDFMTLMIESGMMEYAFNNQVKNLGNYLYRSQAYPLFLTTDLDYIYSNLLGFRFETGFLDNSVKFGAMMNSTISRPPFFDINLGLFASYTMPNKLIDVGFGIVFDRLIARDSKVTDCEDGKVPFDSSLTLRATKLDLRAAVDIKALFPDLDMFGENDLVIYGEAALIGTKDPDYFPIDPEFPQEDAHLYPRPNLIHRAPIMFGLNIPTFKILDYLTFEIEFCKYPYKFDWAGGGSQVINLDIIRPEEEEEFNFYRNEDNRKWSLYAKKSISNFSILAMFANDHKTYQSHNAESSSYTEQSLRSNKDWHWYLKLQYNL